MTEFKYPLTRICLRSGQMMLPLTMQELFPQDAPIEAFDTVSGTTLQLSAVSPRQIAGLADFYRDHDMDVNDSIVVRRMDDGRISLTPVVRPKREDASSLSPSELVDKVLEVGAPLSEAEIRDLLPGLAADLDLHAIFVKDGRLSKHQGRWAYRPKSEGEPQGDRADSPKPTRVTVTAHPHAPLAPPGTRLNADQGARDTTLAGRVREALTRFGYRLDTLYHNQLVAHAELGRRHYQALIHIHPEGEKLDWAGLLAQRRDKSATYLAVFGDHRDLLRLQSPAELARATLWSWQALARAGDLARTIPVSPYDLEPYFQQGGLFEGGLERFERTLGARVSERGHFSAVLARLATMKVPAVFVLEDILADAELPRDQALRVLELLSQAPFHMVARVDNGEFCLRYGVAQGLLHLSEYALSVRDRLPSRHTARLQGVPELDDTHTFDEPKAAEPEKAKPGKAESGKTERPAPSPKR